MFYKKEIEKGNVLLYKKSICDYIKSKSSPYASEALFFLSEYTL